MNREWPTVAELSASAAAFFEPRHVEQAARVLQWALEYLLPRPEPVDDPSARREARELLATIGRAGWLQPIVDQDLRGLALVRENIAAMSPLADAVVALQGLGGVPLLIAGTDAQRARWLPGITDGTCMAGFAMSEPEAGSDVAALQTHATRDGASWVIDGEKHLISNAGLADVYVVFARTSPGPGSRGISAFVVPAETAGLCFAGRHGISLATAKRPLYPMYEF